MKISPRFLSNLSSQLAVVVVALSQERGRAVHRSHPRLGQPALLELLGGDLADGRGPARACRGAGARGQRSGISWVNYQKTSCEGSNLNFKEVIFRVSKLVKIF